MRRIGSVGVAISTVTCSLMIIGRLQELLARADEVIE
jgi:hypothetical protein